jgi:hypothetical protein
MMSLDSSLLPVSRAVSRRVMDRHGDDGDGRRVATVLCLFVTLSVALGVVRIAGKTTTKTGR